MLTSWLPRYSAAFLACVLLLGCHTAVLPSQPQQQAPAYARTAEHYRSFATAAEVAAYLAPTSEAGPLVSAHRGGPAIGYPENALATFERSLQYGPVLIETDVRMSRDSVLVLLHDTTLDRTSTGTGEVNTQTLAELRRVLLTDERGTVTPFRIPTLDAALAWANGRALLTLDIKRGIPPDLVVNAIERLNATTTALVIVYNLDQLAVYHALNPNLFYSVSVRSLTDVERLLASGVPSHQLLAFIGVGELKPDVVERLREVGIRSMMGTFGQIDERAATAGSTVYHVLLNQGLGAIATDNVPATMEAIRTYQAW